jgi:hypothetical protein
MQVSSPDGRIDLDRFGAAGNTICRRLIVHRTSLAARNWRPRAVLRCDRTKTLEGVGWCHHQLCRAVDPLTRSLWVPRLVPVTIPITDLARGRSLPASCRVCFPTPDERIEIGRGCERVCRYPSVTSTKSIQIWHTRLAVPMSLDEVGQT